MVNIDSIETEDMIPKKKKLKTGAIVAIICGAVVLVAAIVVLLVVLLSASRPYDLGVTYTEADYQSAMDKMGIHITFEGMSGDELRDYMKQKKEEGTPLALSDYDFQLSDFEEKQFELTSSEATAFLNEIAPNFFWMKNNQVRVLPNGLIEGSSSIQVRKAVQDLYPGFSGVLPFSLVEEAHVRAAGSISIKENRLKLGYDAVEASGMTGVTPELFNKNSAFIQPIYTCLDGVVIHSLNTTESGTIAVSALIPQSVNVNKKVNE